MRTAAAASGGMVGRRRGSGFTGWSGIRGTRDAPSGPCRIPAVVCGTYHLQHFIADRRSSIGDGLFFASPPGVPQPCGNATAVKLFARSCSRRVGSDRFRMLHVPTLQIFHWGVYSTICANAALSQPTVAQLDDNRRGIKNRLVRSLSL
jgi:hypothetical protein